MYLSDSFFVPVIALADNKTKVSINLPITQVVFCFTWIMDIWEQQNSGFK